MNGFEKVIVVMGLFAFAKQAPKLIGDVIGIDSSNMKLGIGGKLAAGGAFGAAAVLGGATTAAIRNLTHGLGKSAASWNRFRNAQGFGNKIKTFGGALVSTAFHGTGGIVSIPAGGVSGGIRSIKSGFSAKNFKDMRTAAGQAAQAATTARDKRENYRATHGGIPGAMQGHVNDTLKALASWAGISSGEQIKAEQARAQEIADARKAVADRAKAIMEKQKAKRTATSGVTTAWGQYYDNLADIENEIAYAQQHGKTMDGRYRIDAETLRKLQQAKVDLEKQLQKDIVAGISDDGTLEMTKYDGDLMSAITTYRTKLSLNYNSILRNVDRSNTKVNDAMNNLEIANAAASQKINDFITSGNVSKLFDGNDAIENANRKLRTELNAKILKEQENKK